MKSAHKIHELFFSVRQKNWLCCQGAIISHRCCCIVCTLFTILWTACPFNFLAHRIAYKQKNCFSWYVRVAKKSCKHKRMNSLLCIIISNIDGICHIHQKFVRHVCYCAFAFRTHSNQNCDLIFLMFAIHRIYLSLEFQIQGEESSERGRWEASV